MRLTGPRRRRDLMNLPRYISGIACLTSFACLLALVGSAQVPAAKPDPAAIEFFESKVRPVLVEKCFACHGPENQKGGIRLDSREAILKGNAHGLAVSPGNTDTSLILK